MYRNALRRKCAAVLSKQHRNVSLFQNHAIDRQIKRFISKTLQTLSTSSTAKVPILEKLDRGDVVIGDGGMTYTLEKRGYVTATQWIPEAVVEHPEAVRQLHREFALSGADVLQAFVFNGTDDRLNKYRTGSNKLNVTEVNRAGCHLVTEVAKEFGCYVGFPVSATTSYELNLGKDKVQEEFQRQLDAFEGFDCDLLIAEYISSAEEAVWAIEVLKQKKLPIAVSLSISRLGDFNDVATEECGRLLLQAGADIIGTNCRFAPDDVLEAALMMKDGIQAVTPPSSPSSLSGQQVHYICQPNGWQFPCTNKHGHSEEPECPFALDNLLINRWDAQKFARKAYDNGIRYIGGCCGFEPHHVRAMAEELNEERGKLPLNSRGMNAIALNDHPLESMRNKANKEFWMNLKRRDTFN